MDTLLAFHNGFTISYPFQSVNSFFLKLFLIFFIFHLTFSKKRYIIFFVSSCRNGGIGRRAGFRCLWQQCREGSSPFSCTRKSLLQPLPKDFDKRLGIEDRKLVSKCSRASALFMELHCATSSSTGSTSAVMVRQILPLLFHQNQSTNA